MLRNLRLQGMHVISCFAMASFPQLGKTAAQE
jgi:hypothetical protein